MEQKPHKKEELMVANSVLKLAEDLLKVSVLHQCLSDSLVSNTCSLDAQNTVVLVR